MQSVIKVLSIITIAWTSLALVNCLCLIYIISELFFNSYSHKNEDYLFFFGALGLLQIFGIIILLSLLKSFSALDKTRKPNNIE